MANIISKQASELGIDSTYFRYYKSKIYTPHVLLLNKVDSKSSNVRRYFKTFEEAQAFAIRMRTGERSVYDEKTFGSVLVLFKPYWVKVATRNKLTRSTINDCIKNLDVMSKIFMVSHGKNLAEIHINEITSGDISLDIVEYLHNEKSLHFKTIKNYMSCLRKVFDFSIRKNYIKHNPVVKNSNVLYTDIPKKNKSIDSSAVVRLHEGFLDEFIDCVDETIERAGNKHFFTPFELLRKKVCINFAGSTGLRSGEMRALRWQDIDLDSGLVQVNHAIENKTKKLNEGKTKNARRTVPLKVNTVALLKEYKLQSKYTKEDNFVFCRKDGSILISNYFNSCIIKHVLPIYNEKLPKSKQIDLSWHDMRHYYASMLLYSDKFKDDIEAIALLMGHANTNFTKEVYGHWFASDTSRMERLQKKIEAINF